MSKPLPTHGFEWMSGKELANWKNVPCILELDLEYLETLHDHHNDYPLGPESMMFNKTEKLTPNLNNKIEYIIHCENLKLYESLGLKIHRPKFTGPKFIVVSNLRKMNCGQQKARTKGNNEDGAIVILGKHQSQQKR